MPYKETNCLSQIPEKLIAAADFHPLDSELFYEYWFWLFRHGRKQSIRLNRERKEEE
jgi:hypothetical protein